MSNDQMSQAQIQEAEKRLASRLNYGGIHLNGMHSPGHLSMEYRQGDLIDEICQMRELASAFAGLADALEGVQSNSNAGSGGIKGGGNPPIRDQSVVGSGKVNFE